MGCQLLSQFELKNLLISCHIILPNKLFKYTKVKIMSVILPSFVKLVGSYSYEQNAVCGVVSTMTRL